VAKAVIHSSASWLFLHLKVDSVLWAEKTSHNDDIAAGGILPPVLARFHYSTVTGRVLDIAEVHGDDSGVDLHGLGHGLELLASGLCTTQADGTDGIVLDPFNHLLQIPVRLALSSVFFALEAR
jgi:hypothetical protein